jgi:diaminopimelate decarboxylase
MKQVHNADSFFGANSPDALIAKYGSPLYVYNERIFRERCREMRELLPETPVRVNYSTKANANLELLRIIRSEGLRADAMSPGEIHVLLKAGFKPEQILYIGNNVADEELRYASAAGARVSVDSLAQLDRFGRLNPGGRVAIRFNPGVGAGHHEKVVTAGDKTKFGINRDQLDEARAILRRHGLRLAGLNQHIGSLFLDGGAYLQAARALLAVAGQFPELEFVDFGGGFGIPYRKRSGEARLDLEEFRRELQEIIREWAPRLPRRLEFLIEPGRYIVAEAGILLGTVHALKQNAGVTYVGTDLGLNVLLRPALYDAYHEIEVYRNGQPVTDGPVKRVTVVGNICETGDILAKERNLPEVREGDLLAVRDAGAYGYVMSSNYNNRLRPAEVLIDTSGADRLIRRRETLDDLTACFVDSEAMD